jgi:hypothetical protein
MNPMHPFMRYHFFAVVFELCAYVSSRLKQRRMCLERWLLHRRNRKKITLRQERRDEPRTAPLSYKVGTLVYQNTEDGKWEHHMLEKDDADDGVRYDCGSLRSVVKVQVTECSLGASGIDDSATKVHIEISKDLATELQ